jgi:hypothetical protein
MQCSDYAVGGDPVHAAIPATQRAICALTGQPPMP